MARAEVSCTPPVRAHTAPKESPRPTCTHRARAQADPSSCVDAKSWPHFSPAHLNTATQVTACSEIREPQSGGHPRCPTTSHDGRVALPLPGPPTSSSTRTDGRAEGSSLTSLTLPLMTTNKEVAPSPCLHTAASQASRTARQGRHGKLPDPRRATRSCRNCKTARQVKGCAWPQARAAGSQPRRIPASCARHLRRGKAAGSQAGAWQARVHDA